MGLTDRREGEPSLSVVIPSFNSAEWLPSTLRALESALIRTTWDVEIIVVDDGSTDDTPAVLELLSSSLSYPIRVVRQENGGRFLARWAGIQAARSEDLLVLDSRLLLDSSSLEYLESAIGANPAAKVWNGHVITDPAAPLVGHFWLVPTFLFWGDYLSKPRPTRITLENFDRVPKGTGCLIVPKQLFERASIESWPAENARLTSDDTKLLRFIATESPIQLDPRFSAVYRPRTTIRKFLAHAWERGTLFVDSYAGTTPGRNVVLVSLVVFPVIGLGVLIAAFIRRFWVLSSAIAVAGAVALAIPVALASLRGVPMRARLSYVLFVVPFGMAFVAGLARGIVVHRKSFRRLGPIKKAVL